jgi:hypothetical protein
MRHFTSGDDWAIAGEATAATAAPAAVLSENHDASCAFLLIWDFKMPQARAL